MQIDFEFLKYDMREGNRFAFDSGALYLALTPETMLVKSQNLLLLTIKCCQAKSAIRLRTHMNELHKTVKCTICHEEFRGSYALRYVNKGFKGWAQ